MYNLLVLVGVLLALASHEAAHALVLRRYGFPIVEAGLGLPIPPTLRWRPARLPFTLTLSPWLLGAYVKPDPAQAEEIEKLPHRDHAWYSGAGIVVNLVTGLALLAALSAAQTHWRSAAVLGAVAAVLWIARRPFCTYVAPLAGLGMLGLSGFVLVQGAGEPQGPVALAEVLLSDSLSEALTMIGIATVALGLVNLVPIFPMDGGRITLHVVARLFGRTGVTRYKNAGLLVFLALLAYGPLSDLFYLL